MQGELKALQRQLGITFVFVTHDQEEALAMSDRVVVLSAGPATRPIGEFSIDLVRPRIGVRPLGAHFHNTRGAGLASAWARASASAVLPSPSCQNGASKRLRRDSMCTSASTRPSACRPEARRRT